MKTKTKLPAIKTIAAIVLFALSTTYASAGETPNVSVVSNAPDEAKITMVNKFKVSELSVEDLNGNMVYYKEGNITTKDYSKIFNFSNLKDGVYKVLATNSFGTTELIFTINENRLVVAKNENDTKPFIKAEKNILKVSHLNAGKKPVYLTIYDEEADIFTTRLGKEFSITAGFDLSKLGSGAYTAVLSDSENYFRYTFEKP